MRRVLPVLLVALASLVLTLHTLRFDFVCDDAFIVLRYARNLGEHGEAVYNLGERVEGYSSPLWLALSTAGLMTGADGPSVLRWLGLVSGWGLMAALARLGFVVFGSPAMVAVLLVLLGATASVAAWTSGGLETPLFALLVTLVAAEFHVLTEQATKARALRAGVLLGILVLTRHEGLLFVIPFLALAWRRETRKAALSSLAAVAVVLGAFLVWRVAYYGALLPNTFAVKGSGVSAWRLARGVHYLFRFIVDYGVVPPLLLLASPFWPSARGVVHFARWSIPPYLAFVVWAGGDFLDLYRFLMPILALTYVTLLGALQDVLRKTRVRPPAQVGLAVVVLAAHVLGNAWLGTRALRAQEPERETFAIEPLGWTKRQALIWAATGQWLAREARPGDSTATGAAGALPYYSKLRNLDLYGLTNRDVARDSEVRATRPGHQRRARLDYVLAQQPTFLFGYRGGSRRALPDDSFWEKQGYSWLSAPINNDLTLPFLVRRERAVELQARGAGTIGPGP